MNLYGMTDIGKKRETNQDVFYTHKCSDRVGFAVLCDGMGGQNGGHIASDTACSTISKRLIEAHIQSASPEEIKRDLIAAFSEANLAVYKKSNLEPGCKGMGTTAVVAVIAGGRAYIAHVGDSRAYAWKEGKIRQLTKDHSLVQELVEQGKLTPDEMRTHPNKNIITRVVGVNLLVDIDYMELALEEGEKLLLCSDGLSDMVADGQMADVLESNDAVNACRALIGLANQSGGRDNITVVVIE